MTFIPKHRMEKVQHQHDELPVPTDPHPKRAEHFEKLRQRALDRLAAMPAPRRPVPPPQRARPDVKPRPRPVVIFAAFETVAARRNSLNLVRIMTKSGQHVAATEERRSLIEAIRLQLEADGFDCARDMLAISTYVDDRLIGRIKRA